MTNKEQLATLYKKFLDGQCSRKELLTLLVHFEKEGQDTSLRDLIKQHLEQYPPAEKVIQERIDKVVARTDQALFESKAKNRLPEDDAPFNPGKEIPLFGRWKPWAAAASIAAILILGTYALLSNRQQPEEIISDAATVQEGRPGSDRALLTLGDGTIIDLEVAENGRLNAPEATIINKGEGQLIYQILPGTTEREVVYNTITTPRGGQYEVVLPDGTHVWLNAGSSLHFPTAFTGGERYVEITGEVYLEVSSDKKKPFIVKVASTAPGGEDMEVTVLGTKFNIMAYSEETSVKTTLLEGAVKVSLGANSSHLKPGLQAVIDKRNDHMDIRKANLQQAVAWKEGRFEFNGSIQEIMRKIARWYDLEVEYQGNIGNKEFIGAISRKENVQEVLRMLELTGGIRFEVENRTIRVMPSN